VLQATPYFRRIVQLKRPYATDERIAYVLEAPDRQEIEPSGRIRSWRAIPELGGKVMRVVTLEDGITVLNAFLDRNARRIR